MSDTNEPATIKDLVERFRTFGFRLETYPINGDRNLVNPFEAVDISPRQVIESFNFAEKIPFRLDRNELSLYP